MSKKLKKIEKSVLKIYQKNNPSIHFVLEDNKKLKQRKSNLENLIFNNLKFPKKMFEKSNLIDFGAGTGDTTIAYNHWGANCTLVDMNQLALSRAKKVFKKLSTKNSVNKFVKASIFDNKLKNKKYDIVSSIGVIHHTANPALALKKISRFVKNDGFLILGSATNEGFFQRNLQRLIISKFTKLDNHEQVEKIALELFKENLSRAKKFGGRSIKAIIHDTYVNPKIKGISFNEISKHLGEEFSYYSSAPDVNLIKSFDSPLSYQENILSKFQNLSVLSKILMMSNSNQIKNKYNFENKKLKKINKLNLYLTNNISDFNKNKKVDLNKFKYDLKKYKSIFLKTNLTADMFGEHKIFIRELEKLLLYIDNYSLEKMKKYIVSCNVLFKKSGGLGNNYYIFRRNP
jgi:ubiquinone/menaquinone biosynthesis C-methylase UbiE